MPYDEIYYQRLFDDEPDIVREISVAINEVIEGMGKPTYEQKGGK